MLILFPLLEGAGGNGSKAYQCLTCGSLITYSDRLLSIGGANRHLFVNPVGVECDFYTFSSCPGATPHGAGTEAHTWFPGYRWRLAFCRYCYNHLGWHYEAASSWERPGAFWGILISHLFTQ
jgi:hypothetical protein